VSTPSSPASRPPVISAGMVLVDHLTPPIPRLPRSGELIAVDQLYLNIGGGAANTSMALGRLGVPVSVSARIGDDAFGRFIVESLQAGGVGTDMITVDRERETSQTLIVTAASSTPWAPTAATSRPTWTTPSPSRPRCCTSATS